MGEKEEGVMDGTQIFDVDRWGIVVPVANPGKL